jgi:ribosomal protein L37AE/L43A
MENEKDLFEELARMTRPTEQEQITAQRKELAAVVQSGWECRKCGDVFTKPRFRWDYDYEQMAPFCPCCNEYL